MLPATNLAELRHALPPFVVDILEEKETRENIETIRDQLQLECSQYWPDSPVEDGASTSKDKMALQSSMYDMPQYWEKMDPAHEQVLFSVFH